MINIKLRIVSDRKDVQEFLFELREILEDKDFDANKDLIVIKKQKSNPEYSTPYTLMDLNYDDSDVVERLKELTVKEYSESLIDREDSSLSILFVFGKDINNRLVYIKLKIKNEKRRILCLSFHYAEWEMNFPYA